MRTSVLLALLTACTISQTIGAAHTPVTDEQVLPCEADTECPDRTYCAPELAVCFTDVRCVVDGQPSNLMCQRAFGRDFGCYEFATANFHCVPIEAELN